MALRFRKCDVGLVVHTYQQVAATESAAEASSAGEGKK